MIMFIILNMIIRLFQHARNKRKLCKSSFWTYIYPSCLFKRRDIVDVQLYHAVTTNLKALCTSVGV